MKTGGFGLTGVVEGNLLALMASFLWAWPGTAPAQGITTVYSFSADGSNGANPYADLTLAPDGSFYGTTRFGGATDLNGGLGDGTVFQVTTNGALTTLVNFNGTNGADPLAALAIGPDGSFYGTTQSGGDTSLASANGVGTVFKVTPGGVLTTLVDFDGTNGSAPWGGLTLGPDGTFYGTTGSGGNVVGPGISDGTVFKVTSSGMLSRLAAFDIFTPGSPAATLALGADGNFYGTTSGGAFPGGTEAWGSVFQIATNGTLRVLAFRGGSSSDTNGTTLYAGLTVAPDGSFYGATLAGGLNGFGTVFKITTNGTWTRLLSFASTNGAAPAGTLALAPDGNLYGTTSQGGASNDGTVFKLAADGTLTTLANFNGTNGLGPWAGLTLGADGNFYGTTRFGGSGGNGAIYRLNLPPDFITGPADQSVGLGSDATFISQPFGTGPFSYQWLSNGIPLPGATGPSFTAPNVSWLAAGARFQVIITNTWGSITSGAALLNVLPPPNLEALANSGGGGFTLYLSSYPNSTNRLWAATNLALPLPLWQVIATNLTDSNGLAQFLDTNTAGTPAKYYRLSSP